MYSKAMCIRGNWKNAIRRDGRDLSMSSPASGIAARADGCRTGMGGCHTRVISTPYIVAFLQ